MTTWLHEERLGAVMAAVQGTGARSVADLGCGGGDFLLRLVGQAGIGRIVGIDISADAILRLRARLDPQAEASGRVVLRVGSMTEADPGLRGLDCAVLIETIEHLAPADLPRLEHALFAVMAPDAVILTTPNAEFNALLGVPAGRFRHPGHRFEWTRGQFGAWAGRVAGAHGYEVGCAPVGGRHPELGGASQMAVFRRKPRAGRGRGADPEAGPGAAQARGCGA